MFILFLMLIKYFYIFFLGLPFFCNSQDLLFTATGEKLVTKVLEINPLEVKYKDFNNLDGPTYIVSITEVVLIQYKNGTTEVINSNPTSVSPKKETIEPSVSKSNKFANKPMPNLLYMNANLLSVNSLALANGDVALMFDRDFFKSKMSITFLGAYNFNSRMNVLNFYISDTKEFSKKKYDIGFGINFMPRNTKRTQYYIGFLAKYMAYDYKKVSEVVYNQKIYTEANAYQLALMVTNGWTVRISPFFNFKIFGAFGVPINSTPLTSLSNNGNMRNYTNSPKVYLGYCFGYRFN